MGNNVYDIFKGVQNKRKDCYDKRSAAFIIDGKMAKTIYHARKTKDIAAALVFNHKEGPDEVIVYSLLADELMKSDYFIYENINYLVYEENKLTDADIIYRKQKAVECNVSFSFNSVIFKGYFKSSLRGTESDSLESKQILMPDENPVLILPTNSELEIKSQFVIEGKPFKVVEYDHITNRGITYYSLERGIIKNEATTGGGQSAALDPAQEKPLEANETIVQDDNLAAELVIRAMIEYTFSTEDAIFSATPSVELISRRKSEIKFKVPFGIEEVAITTKENGIMSQKLYKVVL